ncbi:MAG: HAD family phosphatase [Candidatus Bathyarchaeia archaeon]
MFDAVIFDWDGTLADTREVVVRSFQKVLAEIHCEVNEEFIERRIGTGAAETFREILRVSGRKFDEDDINQLVTRKVKAQLEFIGKVKLFDGASELLLALHGNVKLAVASMNNRTVVSSLLTRLNLLSFFNAVITVDDVRHPKPDPEIFLIAAQQLGCPAEKCVVVEDSVFGIQAAAAAKMRSIAVLTGAYSKEDIEKYNPDLIVNSLKEKDAIFNFICK